MKTQWFQNKKVLISINIAQTSIILVWLGYLSFFTGYKYRIVEFGFGQGFPQLNIFGIPIYPAMGNPGHLIFKTHLFISLPILLLYRIWIYRRLNSKSKKNIKNLQFGFISLSTLLLIQILTQLLLFKKIFPIIVNDETTNFVTEYIWYGGIYNGSRENFNNAAISQAKILIYSATILYFAAFVSIIKSVIIPYFQKKMYLKKNMKEIVTEHKKLITNLKN